MLKNITFTDFGTIASILGLILSILIFFFIRKIKSFYIFKIRVPGLSKRLQDIASSISSYLNDYESSINSIDEAVVTCEVVLKSLKGKLSGSIKKAIKDLIKKIDQNSYDYRTKDNIRDIYISILKISEEIKELQEDSKWER
ncbi:hypothetical protein LCGC14_0953010 [marine sediment metagenome]|uniref:Uncharacterized protein n=1 Tax=marine sediment metagenome TaxID=412755 RepID=A0A0F9NL86_9ZZZZ|nr:hypothetical protein [Candidatus Aminicenantes bacterium]